MPMGVKVAIHEEEDDDAQVSRLQNTNTADQTRPSAGDQSTAQGTTENSRDQQHAQIEEATKKVDEFAFMMNKQKQKNVLCPATVHGHGVIYLSLNF